MHNTYFYNSSIRSIIVAFGELFSNFQIIRLDSDKKDFYLLVNGSLILYGILRGIVANSTGVFRIKKFMFPTVMMHEEVKRFIEKKDKLNKAKKTRTKEKE